MATGGGGLPTANYEDYGHGDTEQFNADINPETNPFEDEYEYEEYEEYEEEIVEDNNNNNNNNDNDNVNNNLSSASINNSTTAATPDVFASTNYDDDLPAPPPMDDHTFPPPTYHNNNNFPPPKLGNARSLKNVVPPPPSKTRNKSPLSKHQSLKFIPPPPASPPPPTNNNNMDNDINTTTNLKPSQRRGRNKNIVTSPPNGKSGTIIPTKVESKSQDQMDCVSFTDVLRQVDVGIEMHDRLKEVIRKFSKHQQMGADKLQEIFAKLPATYKQHDGMKQFADVCQLVHTLILETVSSQKRMADFLHKDIVPKMDSYIKEKQSQIQKLKRDNQQAEMKVKNAVNSMNKSAKTAKDSAVKAKQATVPKRRNTTEKKKGMGSKFKSLTKKMGKKDDFSGLPEDEQIYMRAQQHQKNYEASVMSANHEQIQYHQTQSRFKKDLRSLEEQRLSYCNDKVIQLLNAHKTYFNNDKITALQNRISSSLDGLNYPLEFDQFLLNKISEKGPSRGPSPYKFQHFDYQNAFHSLQDSMDITHKLAPHSKLPLMLTSLCNKVRELNGFNQEGIFRKSAAATEVDKYKARLSSNNYSIDTSDPHLAACLLKDWLRGLKDSLIPQSHYDICITMAKSTSMKTNKNEINNESLNVFLSQIPEVNRETIKYLCKFLKELSDEKHSKKSKMTVDNIAIVFAPTILKCPHSDPQILLANSKHEKTFTVALIKELETC